MAADPRRLVVLDLDRTIFHTGAYYRDFLGMLTESYNLQLASDMRGAEASSEHFDPFAYLEQQGIAYRDATAAFQVYLSHQYPDGRSYLFPDALELLHELEREPGVQVAIITTGSLRSQQFKFSLCPQLADIPKEILGTNKGERLQADLNEIGAVSFHGRRYPQLSLVDDRVNVLTNIKPHPDNRLVHIFRPGTKYQESANRPDIMEVTTLSNVYSLLIPQKL